MNSIFAFVFAAIITLLFLWSHLKNLGKREARALQAAEKGALISAVPALVVSLTRPLVDILTPRCL